MPYDIVIKNGMIVDGTGRPAYRADLAVSQGKIVEIGKVRDGAAKTIRARTKTKDHLTSPEHRRTLRRGYQTPQRRQRSEAVL